jgi:hypothetical protein
VKPSVRTLHAAALVVHADQQVLAHGLDIGAQLDQLRAVRQLRVNRMMPPPADGPGGAVVGAQRVPAMSIMRGRWSCVLWICYILIAAALIP